MEASGSRTDARRLLKELLKQGNAKVGRRHVALYWFHSRRMTPANTRALKSSCVAAGEEMSTLAQQRPVRKPSSRQKDGTELLPPGHELAKT